jgi:DNA-binding transcriptional ArsR family regulator
MSSRTAQLDQVFRALSDPTRRAVLARLNREGPAPMSDLARPFKMALPSFSQHLDVLESSGLVRSTKRGRVRTYRLAPRRLEAARHWLDEQHDLWAQRLDRLDDFLTHPEHKEPER